MDLHHLEHFVVLAEEESLTAAAHRLHLAQSSVSTSLASLERAVGARLVDRGPGRSGLELTRAGRIFLTHAYTVLQAVRTAREAVHTEPGDLHGTIRIATTMIPRDADVAAAVRRFLQDHPRVRLDVAHGPAPQVMSLLERGEADLGVSPRTDAMPATIQDTPLLRTPVVVLCPPQHAASGRTDLTPFDLRDEPFVDLAQPWWLRQQFDAAFHRAELKRRPRIQLSQWHTALDVARSTGRLTYGPLAAVPAEGPSGLQVAHLADAPSYDFAVLHSTARPVSEATRALLAAFSEVSDRRSHGPAHDGQADRVGAPR